MNLKLEFETELCMPSLAASVLARSTVALENTMSEKAFPCVCSTLPVMVQSHYAREKFPFGTAPGTWRNTLTRSEKGFFLGIYLESSYYLFRLTFLRFMCLWGYTQTDLLMTVRHQRLCALPTDKTQERPRAALTV